MKKSILLILALICCFSLLYSQQQPKSKKNEKVSTKLSKQKSRPISSEQSVLKNFDLTSISVVASGEIFVAGYNTEFEDDRIDAYALLWKIANHNVTVDKLPFLGRIGQMFWLDNQTGWVLGWGESIYKTTDGGREWEELKNARDIYGNLFFLNADTGWYFGHDEYLKQIDNGRIEKLKLFENFPHVRKLQFTSIKNGWLFDVVRSQSRFQRTEDGGKNWDVIIIDDNAGIDDFQFINDYEGFALTSKGLYSTNESGKSWKLIKPQSKDEQFAKLFFLDAERGWLIGKQICFTADAGSIWKCNYLPKKLKDKYSSKKDFVFTDTKNGWFLAETGLYVTSDGGNTWYRKKLTFGNTSF